MFWIELRLVLVAVVLAFAFPGLGSRGFLKLERVFHWLVRRPRFAVLAIGLGTLAARALVLPVEPIPEPTIPDEFSHLLLADTLAHGRLANPTHPMGVHFESLHILWHPTYASMYYPAQGLFLAAGKVIAGHPFWGVWLSAGLMCAAICWALQGWMSAGWALLGGSLAIMRLGAFSYWANSYFGGAVPALGGALVLGALPRIQRRQHVGDALLLGLGLAVLAGSRPYEGVFLALPVALALFAWMLGKKGPRFRVSMQRVVAPTTLVVILASGALAYYFWRVTGSPIRFPYRINMQTYGWVMFPWQKPTFPPQYHHAVLRGFYQGEQKARYEEARQNPIRLALWKIVPLWFFFVGPALTLPLIMLIPSAPYPFSFRAVGSKTRLLLLVCFSAYLGLALIAYPGQPHYVAPATAALYVLILRAMRHLRLWRMRGRPVGLSMVRAVPSICFLMLMLRAAAPLPGVPVPPMGPATWASSHSGNLDRARVLAELKATPGNHLVIVRYNPGHKLANEWVYNEADIDLAKVVWARDMSPSENQELLAYFKNRRVWMVDVDHPPAKLLPYGNHPGGHLGER